MEPQLETIPITKSKTYLRRKVNKRLPKNARKNYFCGFCDEKTQQNQKCDRKLYKMENLETEEIQVPSIVKLEKHQISEDRSSETVKNMAADEFKENSSENQTKHLKKSENKKFNYYCRKSCGLKFVSYIDLKAHQDEFGHNRKFRFFSGPGIKCPECDMEFKTRIGFYGHLLNHSYYDIECSVCNMKFSMHKHLYIYQARTGHENPPKDENFECPICNQKLKTQETFSYHLKNQEKFKTSYDDPTSDITSMQAQQQENIHEFSPAATKLDLSFKNPQFFHNILEENLLNFFYKCEECQIYFPFKEMLEEHQKIASHNNAEENFKRYFNCSKCGLQFSLEDEIEPTLAPHEKFKYLCEFCGVKMPHKKNLKEHKQKSHSDESQKRLCENCENDLKNSDDPKQVSEIKTEENSNVDHESSRAATNQCNDSENNVKMSEKDFESEIDKISENSNINPVINESVQDIFDEFFKSL